eukprot:jgi/Ulvmu1/9270/UM050_0019.1
MAVDRAAVEKALSLADDAEEGRLWGELDRACRNGDVPALRNLLERGADLRYQEPEHGRSALMIAAACGHLDAVTFLLEHGVPWNAQDRSNLSAGELSSAHPNVQGLLVQWGCLCETILPDSRDEPVDEESRQYLQQKLSYDDTTLLDANNEAVMMDWEKPLMLAHANLICQGGGDILNIGFGLGLVDDAIQGYQPRSHTIVEAHPDVYQHMIRLGWDKKDNVTIHFGRWQDVVSNLKQYDGVFFDTYAEHYKHMRSFHALLPTILKPEGIYSFFNGLAPRSAFFQKVYRHIVADELSQKGFETQFMELPVNVESSGWDKAWETVKTRYFFADAYHLPIVYWKDLGTEDKSLE